MVPRLIRPYGWVSLFYLFYWEDVVYIIINIILFLENLILKQQWLLGVKYPPGENVILRNSCNMLNWNECE